MDDNLKKGTPNCSKEFIKRSFVFNKNKMQLEVIVFLLFVSPTKNILLINE
jgi:hypothetical protein